MNMRFLRATSFFALLLAAGPLLAQESTSAGDYLSFLGDQHRAISKAMLSYISAVNHGKSARKVDKRRVELIQQMKQSELNVRRMKPYQKDSKLRDSTTAFLRLAQHVVTEDYGKILNMEDIAEQSYDLMEAYLLAKEKANDKLDLAEVRLEREVQAFASANNIRLVESESKLSQKMEQATKVNLYYNKVYLVFFKSFKDEVYFLDALNKGDVGAMEQSNNALIASVNEGLTKVGPQPAYNGDGSLKAACQQVLTFYKKATTAYFPVFVEFQLKKENFEKMKKAMDAKRNPTQEDNDAFNKAVKDYNLWVNKVNNANNEYNKGRQSVMDSWTNRSNGFLDKHTPN